MRIRTLALALALSCGAATMVQAAPKSKVHKAKHVKPRKYKQAKASKIKPHKAPKHR